MSENAPMLADAVTRLFRDAGDVAARAERDGWQADLWEQMAELGLPQLLVAEADGGAGGDWQDAHAVLQPAGYYSVPLPLGETMLAHHHAAAAGLALPATARVGLAVDTALRLEVGEGGHRVSGTLRGVPWGRDVDVIVALAHAGDESPWWVLLPRTACELTPGTNLAFEPRDDLRCAAVEVQAAPCQADRLFEQAALLRIAQITGALQAALHRSIEYAQERKQFGRSIGKFQAVQQQLALFGADVAAVACAAGAAARAADHGEAGFQIAAAKLRANQAIGQATAIAHQVHAAIGFTQEYPLRHATQRLWSWRSEFGNDRLWADRLGAEVAARGADRFWADLTARDDAVALASI